MDILKKPILTEKLTAQGEKANVYGFIVDPKANKIEIKKAIELMYGVTILSVNTMRYVGKFKSRNTKKGLVTGRAAAFKKAIVYLEKGATIDFYNAE